MPLETIDVQGHKSECYYHHNKDLTKALRKDQGWYASLPLIKVCEWKPQHFIIDNDNQKVLLLVEVIQEMHCQQRYTELYTIYWMTEGWETCISQHFMHL